MYNCESALHSLFRGSNVSPVQLWILLVISEGPNYGYNVIQQLEKMFAGYWKPKAGTIYPALEKLSEKDLITGETRHREEGPDRRYYTITEKGKQALRHGINQSSKVIEHIELYGERHRTIRRFQEKTDREKLGDFFIKLGESFKRETFDLSTISPAIEPEIIRLVEPIKLKFLYAHENSGLEIEIEVEWSPEKEDS